MTNFLTKIKQLDIEIALTEVHEQAAEVTQIISAVRHQQVLSVAPQPLGFLPDRLEELGQGLSPHSKQQLKIINQLFNSLRQFLSVRYGIWSLPNLATANLIKEQLQVKQALEIMAGNAYWAKALAKTGIKTVATDSLAWAKTSPTGNNPFFTVQNYSATAAINNFRTVDLIICAWAPNFTTSDLAAIATWRQVNPQSHLLFIGEKQGATNSSRFWEQAHFRHSTALQQINDSFSSFDFINEQIFEIDYEI